MAGQGYERVSRVRDSSYFGSKIISKVPENEVESPRNTTIHQIPNSPPPSFRSRDSSPASHHQTPGSFPSDVDNTLAETFDGGDESDDETVRGDDRQRLMRGTGGSISSTGESTGPVPPHIPRRNTELPTFTPPVANTRTYNSHGQFSGFSSSNDGVFANLSAKPERGEKEEEQPPVSRPSYTFRRFLLTFYSHMNKLPQMLPHPTGRRQ
jgi:hypothetical protein